MLDPKNQGELQDALIVASGALAATPLLEATDNVETYKAGAGAGLEKAKTTLSALKTFFIGNLNSSKKSYKALLSQATTAAPTAVVLDNSLSAAIVWARTSAGLYTGTLVAAFTNVKTMTIINQNSPNNSFTIARTSADVVTVTSKVTATGVSTDALLSGTEISIEVYP